MNTITMEINPTSICICMCAVKATTGAMPMPHLDWGCCMAWPVPAIFWR